MRAARSSSAQQKDTRSSSDRSRGTETNSPTPLENELAGLFSGESLSRLDRQFFDRAATVVAPALIGTILALRHPEGLRAARIVETEAYGGTEDPASHASRGRTPRNSPMFEAPGHAYVYLSYGVHHLLNFVTGPSGKPGAVLVRACEPLLGIERMRGSRGVSEVAALCSGPGKLSVALGVDLTDNRHDVVEGGEIGLFAEEGSQRRVACAARVGISSGLHHPWRYYQDGSPHVSRG